MSILSLDGSECVVMLDDAGGDPEDITEGLISISLGPVTYNGSHFHVLGNLDALANVGGRLTTGQMVVVGDNDPDSADGLMRAWLMGEGKPDARTLQVDYPDSETGSLRATGEIVPDSYDPALAAEAGSGEVQRRTIPFKFHGPCAISVIAGV